MILFRRLILTSLVGVVDGSSLATAFLPPHFSLDAIFVCSSSSPIWNNYFKNLVFWFLLRKLMQSQADEENNGKSDVDEQRQLQ